VNAFNAEAADQTAAVPADFDAIFAAHYEPVARAIARVLRDRGRAEELTVDAFWRLLRNPKVSGAQVGGWLHRTAVRLALDELRRRARQVRYERWLVWTQSTPQPDQLFAADQEQGRVRAALAAIAPRQAELLLLRHDGMSYQELASSLDLNPASVGTLLSRAQEAFRKEYIKRYGEPES
jgi:RNA polymerase sigma-70 factor (ECF subfamily)